MARHLPLLVLLALTACGEPAPTAPPICAGASTGEWEFLGLRADSLAYVTAVATDPADPKRILAGTHQDFSGGIPGRLFLSEDDGQTWQQVLTSRFFSDVLFDPTVPDTAYAASADAVFKSTDGGRTWVPTSADVCTDAESFVQFVQRSSDGALYTGVIDINSVCETTLYRSEDGGQTWVDLCEGQDDCLPAGPISLGQDPSDPRRLFAGLNFLAEVHKSEDRGETWTVTGYNGGLPKGIVVDLVDPDLVYVSERDEGAFLSRDGGATWEAFDEGLPAHPHGGSLIQDRETRRLYLLAAGSAWWRDPGNPSWTEEPIPGEDLVSGGALHLTEGRVLYVGSIGLWRRDVKTITATEPGPCDP